MNGIKDKVAVIGVGVSKFGENWDKGTDDMLAEAVYEALDDAGLKMTDIQAGWIGTVLGGYGGSILAEALGWDLMPVTRVENN